MIGIVGVGIAAYLPVSSESKEGVSAGRGYERPVVAHLLQTHLHMSEFA